MGGISFWGDDHLQSDHAGSCKTLCLHQQSLSCTLYIVDFMVCEYISIKLFKKWWQKFKLTQIFFITQTHTSCVSVEEKPVLLYYIAAVSPCLFLSWRGSSPDTSRELTTNPQFPLVFYAQVPIHNLFSSRALYFRLKHTTIPQYKPCWTCFNEKIDSFIIGSILLK